MGVFKHKIGFLFLLLLPICLKAQERQLIEIVHADFLRNNENIVANAQRLIGNVELESENIYMYCDSAYSYNDKNMVDAFGNVHIIKDDTLHMYADYINYNEDTKWAEAYGNVRLVNKSSTLTTDTLHYDMNNEIGYYEDYGTVKDSTNTLFSKIGEYYAQLDKTFFKTEVEATTPNYTLVSDTLIYEQQSGIVSILGPTTIFNETDTLLATYGFYNTQTEDIELFQRPVFINENQNITADSIYYNKETGDGKALGNADIHDFENRMIVRGNKVTYNEKMETAMVTDSAHFLLYTDLDTLYLRADTLSTVPDTIPNEKIIKAYYKVRFFREDLQGKCDSLVYWSKDSTVQMFTDPVVWSGDNQITADYIEMITLDKENQKIDINQNAFIIAMEDSTKYNQIKGRDMTGYIRDNDLYRIDVDGNGQSIYYARDENGIVGINIAQSSNIQIFLTDSKVNKIKFIESPDGQLRPMIDVTDQERKLSGFSWLDNIRPKSYLDIFTNE